MNLDVAKTLSQLKDFQRNTVEHVFQRMYLDDKPALRFLIADEVGLGKTMVAKGIIAKAVDHLLREGKVGRIDIVYVCSNAAIAAQNLNRLNVTGEKERIFATRLTLVPSTLRELSNQRVNFISFTPGTTFNLGWRGGIVEERAVLYGLIKASGIDLDMKGLSLILQGQAGDARWASERDWPRTLDIEMQGRFSEAISKNEEFRQRLEDLCRQFASGQPIGGYLSEQRYRITGELRHALAKVCVDALEPDLIILDEFQRFKDLLHGEDEAAELARTLWNYKGKNDEGDARTLLLSATPYKMVTLDHEADDDHYPDFLRTMGFLLGDAGEVAQLKADLDRFRRALYGISGIDDAEATAARKAVEDRLKSVMVRTERVGSTVHLDSMVSEPKVATSLHMSDLQEARLLAGVAKAVGGGETIEYWKSAPYLMQFMRDYHLKRQLKLRLKEPRADLAALFSGSAAPQISEQQVQQWQAVEPGNSRLRALADATLEHRMWEMLWLPPSLTYLEPDGAYAGQQEATKSLVFSSWNVVPDAIAAVLSYEAERRMLAGSEDLPAYSDLHDKRRPLLRFQVREGKRSAMAALGLLYPSPSLTSLVDPLRLALDIGLGAPMPVALAKRHAAQAVRLAMAELEVRTSPADGRVDERWYWAAPAMLDQARHPATRQWLASRAWRSTDVEDAEDAAKGFAEHIEHLVQAFDGRLDPPLGRAPDDLYDVLGELALAGPGVCASRALGRIAPDLPADDPARLSAAGAISTGLRTLFNLPETMTLLRAAGEGSYWQVVLRHGLGGNLQAVLDEYVHVLSESLGVQGHPPAEAVAKIGAAVAEAVSLRTARLDADTFDGASDPSTVTQGTVRLRTRFALRFGEIRDDNGAQLARADTVRQAFNSPFRPFVLASTSVGQEGLDFHTYCHVLWHWNLPSNPVDLEQREGRVHRYKGHAVRKNVALKYGLSALVGRTVSDPWAEMFAQARRDRKPGLTDLVPYWVFETENGARVERRVPMPPLSREHGQLDRLKQALAVYRLVFGQPRQQDLMTHLQGRLLAGEAVDFAKWRICLGAPERVVGPGHVRVVQASGD